MVRLLKRANGRDDAPVIFDLTIDASQWASVIASMSYYGEEDYGYYRALHFHAGVALDATTPLKSKLAVPFNEHTAAAICGVICQCGPGGAPLACAWLPNHKGEHSWADLTTLVQ
jgi:hypothetical protein